MYHLIYKIKNKTNGKIYIGKHSTEDPKDKYMGSGTMIKKAIEEEGIDKFKKTILEFCKDEKCQSKKELEWIKRLNTTYHKR